MSEQRRYFRHVYSAPARLSQGEQQWQTRLLDISLQGALLDRPADWPEHAQGLFGLGLYLPDADTPLKLEVEACHEDAERLGVFWPSLDVDSTRRLVQLLEQQPDSEALLARDLIQLLADLRDQLAQPHT